MSDRHEEEAAKLLLRFYVGGGIISATQKLLVDTVAAALRERDERIAMLRATLDICYDAERSSGELRRALDEKLSTHEAEVASLQTAERVAAEIAQDQIAAIEGHLRYIAGCHLKDDQQRERIGALEVENAQLKAELAQALSPVGWGDE